MNAKDAVIAFLTSLAASLEALRQVFITVQRDGPAQPLTGQTVEGERRREGHIDRIGTYKFHGTGCRLELEDGAELDFDWDAEGNAVFDAWRLRKFARSLSMPDFGEADLISSCRELVLAGVLEEDEYERFHVRP